MWPFKKKLKQRRLEVRKGIAAGTVPVWSRFRQTGSIGAILVTVGLYVGVVLMNIFPLEPQPYRRGQYIPADIPARVPFKVPVQKEIEDAKRNAKSSVPPTFRLNSALLEEIVSTLRNFPEQLAPASKPATRPAVVPAEEQPSPQLLAGKDLQSAEKHQKDAWQKYTAPSKREDYLDTLDHLRARLATYCIVRPDEADTQQPPKRNPGFVWLVHDSKKDRRSIRDLVSLNEKEKLEYETTRMISTFDPAIRYDIRAYLMKIFESGKALYRYDGEATQADITAALEEIERDPPSDRYEAGDVLVRASRRGDRIVSLSEAELKLLQAEHKAYHAAERQDYPWRIYLRSCGRAVILLLFTATLCLYIALYQPRIIKNYWRAFAIATVILLMLVINKVMTSILNANPYWSLVPMTLAGMILTLAYERRFAAAVSTMLAVFVVFQLSGSFALLVVLTSGVAASIFQLREIRSRSKLLKVSGIAAGVVFITILAISFAAAVPFRFTLTDGIYGAVSVIIAGLLMQGILPMIERIFRIATSMTLLEWCDASKPLLKRLAMEAPGTYNHSLQLGAMCEAAAEAVGAQGLLARVGAYYHDIGKINKPDYFIENQVGETSKHEKLSPAMSLLIITGHVKDGLEMAKEYSLPRVLHEFIVTHHGTTLVEYFYQAAAEQRKEEEDRAPDEVEFRHPGPKPKSKEAAILMLADAAESSVRSMSEPTPGRIENQVNTMVTRRLMDGQLDECELTLREVHQIETSLVKSLCSTYHTRIAYPTPPGQKASAAEIEANNRQKAKSGGEQEDRETKSPD